MKEYKLSISPLPRGAWNNDFSKTLPKCEWDTLRKICYKKANHKCQICGFVTDEIDAHEVWEFDLKNKIQRLKDIIGICSKCHGVIHFKNSVRLGYGNLAKAHFLNVNKCSELDFVNHLTEAVLMYQERNAVYRWKIKADLTKFGLDNATIKKRSIPFIKNPYERVDWNFFNYKERNKMFKIIRNNNDLFGAPQINYIEVDNYQGTITISTLFTNKIVWFLDGIKIKTKYNVVGNFTTTLKVENLEGKELLFVMMGDGGETISKMFELLPQEVI